MTVVAKLRYERPFRPARHAMGLATISDKRTKSVFPRCVGFFDFWAPILFVPAGIIAFSETGPVAWNGFNATCIPAVAFGIPVMIMVMAMATMRIRTIRQTDPLRRAFIEGI